jgi:hypothetical protein
MRDLHFWGSTEVEDDEFPAVFPLAQISLPRVKIYSDRGALRSNELGTAVTVLMAGIPMLASDGAFDERTSISRLEPDSAPSVAADLYQRDGVKGLVRLEGDFVVIVLDRIRRCAIFVTDKFGIRDIYIRRTGRGFEFASAVHLLGSKMSTRLNALSTAFFLAQEGFFPAPHTVLEEVTSLGRATVLEIKADGSASSHRYWKPESSWESSSIRDPIVGFTKTLAEAMENGTPNSNFGLLLSGGVDSTLLALLASRLGKKFVTLTGTIKGYTPGENEIVKARAMSDALRVQHRSVIVDPRENSLPQIWHDAVKNWTVGVRAGVPLWMRFGHELATVLGDGFTVVSGQMADTVADNNYTTDSTGYRLRRVFYSPWFYRALPLLKRLTPNRGSSVGRTITGMVSKLAGARPGELLNSLLTGMQDNRAWLEGRVFGFGEFPGRSTQAFPLLNREGVDQVADWYSESFVAPALERIEVGQFYAATFEMSLAMVMLHLDTRVVYQAFSIMGGQSFLPFLTARMVNYFVSIPYSARPIWKKPKWVITEARRRLELKPPSVAREQRSSERETTQEELLLRGSLGDYFRQLLASPAFPVVAPELMKLLNQRYLDEQLSGFRKGNAHVDAKLIFKLAALETWLRALGSGRSAPESLQFV